MAGTDLVGDDGTCYLRRLEYPLDATHGAFPLGAPRHADWERVAKLAKQDEPAAPLEECVFLDTETTGLAVRAPWSSCAAWTSSIPSALSSSRCSCAPSTKSGPPSPTSPPRLRQRPWLVTYVGKSYDRHRIAARMAVHKIDSPLLTDQHLDLRDSGARIHRGGGFTASPMRSRSRMRSMSKPDWRGQQVGVRPGRAIRAQPGR